MNINIFYIILNLLFLLVARIYLKDKNISFQQSLILLVGYLVFTFLTCSWINGAIYSIFHLTFLNVKCYLVLLIVTNLIILYTMNHSVSLKYKILNYLLFMFIVIILGAVLSVALGNKYNQFYIMDISNAVNFMDLSFVIFIIYLIVMSVIYIGSEFFKYDYISIKNDFGVSDFKFSNLGIVKFILGKIKKNNDYNSNLLSTEELLNYHVEDGFYINGEECSIIFDDSNKDNIIKNYYILNEDIHAKMMNGYTLEENKLLKSICMKFRVCSLNNIDWNNESALEEISVDEYNFLRRVFNINES